MHVFVCVSVICIFVVLLSLAMCAHLFTIYTCAHRFVLGVEDVQFDLPALKSCGLIHGLHGAKVRVSSAAAVQPFLFCYTLTVTRHSLFIYPCCICTRV